MRYIIGYNIKRHEYRNKLIIKIKKAIDLFLGGNIEMNQKICNGMLVILYWKL